MRLIMLTYLMVVVFYIWIPSGLCQRGKKNKCKKFQLENGKVKVKSRGRLARLKCKKGYTMIDGDQFLSCVRQQWTGTVPKCIKSGCDRIHEIAHGEAFGLFQGALMQFTCSPGYALNGSPSLACDGNSWNASIPYCGHRTPQEEVELTCDFEDSGLCNWEIVNSPPKKGWKRGQGGPTMPGSSAPTTDHSTGTQVGHFLLVDAAAMGTAAQLFSPVFTPPTEAPACFVLFYHILNHSQNSISVSFKPDNISIDNLNTSVFLRGDSGRPKEDGWTMYYFDLNPYIILEQHFQIILELFPGQGYNSDVAVDDVALAAGSQCIEYELEYEEQQNPPTTTVLKTTTTSLITTEDSSYSEYSTSTNQVQDTGTYQTQSDDLMDITSIITTKDLQNEELSSQLTTKSTQESNTNSIITTTRKIIDNNLDETITYPNTQTTSQITLFQNTTNNLTTIHHSDIFTLGPKMTIPPLTTSKVITLLPPTTSTPLKQRTPEATVQIGTDISLNPTTSLVKKNNTELPTKVPSLFTKPSINTDLTSLQYSSPIASTALQNAVTSQPPSQSASTPPPTTHLPPHPFSDIPTSTIIPQITTESTIFHLQNTSTEPSSHINKVTTLATSSISSSDNLLSTFTSSFTSRTTPQKFTPPPPPPLPPHPFSEMTTTTIVTTKKSDVTLTPTISTLNNNSHSFASTTFSNTIETTKASINNQTHISFPKTTTMFSQPTFFTDTTTHATSTLPTTEIKSQPTTITVMETMKPTTAEHLTNSTKVDIWTTSKPTTKEIIMETSSLSANSSSNFTPETVSTENVTTTKPDITTANIGKTISPNVKNKTIKYSKGAFAAIAVLILVLCVLGIIAISVVVNKYKEYAKEDKLLENSEGSNSSIQFSYRWEGGSRGGGGGQGEIRIPPVNFYGYENPGTPV